ANSQIAGLLAISRHEDEADDSEDFASEDVADDDFAAAGNDRLRMANASNRRNSATAPRKNGSKRWAAVHATISEHNTAPTPQKKFSRLTALALELALGLLREPSREPSLELSFELWPEPELDPISAISKLLVGIISPSPKP